MKQNVQIVVVVVVVVVPTTEYRVSVQVVDWWWMNFPHTKAFPIW